MVGAGETTDGVVVLRPPRAGDAAALVAGRDDEARRWLGPGDPDPGPVAVVVVDGRVAGWVDWDADRSWLAPGEVNVGYSLFPSHRGRGYATRAVHLLLHRMALDGSVHTATLAIDKANARSLAVARRAGFTRAGDVEGSAYFTRPVPPLTYTDGVVEIRPDDLEAFGRGPRWTFTVHAGVARVGHVECDLANEAVPRGEASISCSVQPTYRGKGYAGRAVRLVLRFLADHTGAGEAHVVLPIDRVP